VRSLHLVLTFSFAGALVLAQLGCGSTRSRVPGVTVLPGRNAPQVAVEIYPQRAVFDIESPRGIGSATVEMSGKVRPKHLLLRLHLRGLEEFRFGYDNRTVIVSMASTGSGEVRERLIENGAERALSPSDSQWMPVRPAGGTIEVDASRDFAKSGTRRFTVEWVDFFR
jgi:hypothetical protein